jgi:hypothetical protein
VFFACLQTIKKKNLLHQRIPEREAKSPTGGQIAEKGI